jgi:Ca2+-binding EF-hand superfamily protein
VLSDFGPHAKDIMDMTVGSLDATMAPSLNVDRSHRQRMLRARRWRIAMWSVRFAIRLRSLTRARLSSVEEESALTLYFRLSTDMGSLDNRAKIRSALFAAGQLVDDEELDDLLARVGYEGGTLQFDSFALMLAIRKRTYHLLHDTTDTEAAFRSLMDPQTEDISTTRLLELCRRFNLSHEVEALIRETDADGSGRIDLGEFTDLLDEERDPDDELSSLASAPSASTLHRRAMRESARRTYQTLKRRVLVFINAASSFRSSLYRGGAPLSFNHGQPAASNQIRLVKPPTTMQPPAAARVPAPLSPNAIARSEPARRSPTRQPSPAVPNALDRFATSPYKPQPPPPFVIAPADYKREERRQTRQQTADRLSPRRPPTAKKSESSSASAFNTSAARFTGDAVVMPLQPPRLATPIRRREHPADIGTIYRHARRIEHEMQEQQQRGEDIEGPQSLPSPSMIADRGVSDSLQHTAGAPPRPGHEGTLLVSPTRSTKSLRDSTRSANLAPVRSEEHLAFSILSGHVTKADAAPPDYTTFNPFLGLPPPKPLHKQPHHHHGASLYRGGSARGKRPTTSAAKPNSTEASLPLTARPPRPGTAPRPAESLAATSRHRADHSQTVAFSSSTRSRPDSAASASTTKATI